MAGLAGVVLAINTASFTPFTGFGFLLVIFAAVIVGGIGKPYGAMLGALIIGVITSVAASYMDSAYKDAIAFAVLIGVLLVRPQGIFASRGRG
jgi:branched-subunit amino acid ABC-type transport system permease component